MVIAMPLFPDSIAPASAQEQREKRRNLFDFLFGGALRDRQAEPPAKQRAPRQSRRATTSSRSGGSSSRAAATPQPPPEASVAKLDNARVVLVVGDFLAGGLSEGLEAAYAESPGVRVVNRSSGSSGFVRDDYYDWNAEIATILDETSPTLVVVMIGSNDRQQMVVDGKRETPRSDAWLQEYEKRVERFAGILEERGIPLIWTGLPAFKLSSMTSDMLAFNDIYKTSAEAAGGSFVDIWEGFVDENGAFVFSGPDMNGQPARLRGSDGINLTRAGKRKIAFYVEKPLNKLLGQAISPDIGELGMESLPDLVLHPEKAAPVDRTLPISLADPALDGGTELLGAVVRPTGEAQPDAETALPVDQAPRPGRADDFSASGFTRDRTGSVAREPVRDAPALR
ncbi:hypothetical protein NA2_20148 [Nitratireductor pacificus pht-3B]|uniref:Uncharacterized protein n=2 Tax=Nitratireductor TaxID=245876 RepID=K2M4K4_9HYPH|nr:hypothetical protein NA2_20148 [Nitratireductor pacificus pht-3B]